MTKDKIYHACNRSSKKDMEGSNKEYGLGYDRRGEKNTCVQPINLLRIFSWLQSFGIKALLLHVIGFVGIFTIASICLNLEIFSFIISIFLKNFLKWRLQRLLSDHFSILVEGGEFLEG